MAAIQQMILAAGTSVFLPANLSAFASGDSFTDFRGASALARLTLGSAGTLNFLYNANGDVKDPPFSVSEDYKWLTGGNSSSFSARMRLTSGDPFSTGTTGTWLPITSDLVWTLIATARANGGYDYKALTAVLEIAYTNNLVNILAQCNVSMEVTASSTGSGGGGINLQ